MKVKKLQQILLASWRSLSSAVLRFPLFGLEGQRSSEVNGTRRCGVARELRKAPMRYSTRQTLYAFLACASSATLLFAAPAGATGVSEFPDNGSEQMGRGGAWVARASDPLAAFYNPAGLAGQDTRVTAQANVSFQSTCFTRIKATNDTTADGVNPGAQYPQVCNSVSPSVDPQVGLTYRLTDRIGLGILPLLAPSAGSANTTWPEFIQNGASTTPSPQRYLLLKSNLLLITPTIGAGFEVVDNLRLGASLQWGIAKFTYRNADAAQNQNALPPAANDVTAELSGAQYFIPGFTLGALWSATDNLDVAGWYKWSAPISASGDVKTQANYFTPAVARGNNSAVVSGDTSQANCGDPMSGPVCGSGNNASVGLNIPMEAKLGVRFHQPRSDVPIVAHKRDPMSQDLFDAEVDLTWANNSAVDYLQIRFPGDKNSEGILPVNGTPGFVPPNADARHHFKDVVGVRVGGDYNILPDQLALRLGGFFETNGQDPTYQNIDIDGASRFGFALGGTYRVHLGAAPKTNALEFSLGLMHVFYADENNNNPNSPGLPALAGTDCNPTPATVPSGLYCPSGIQKFRTNWAVNLGTITQSINVINVGVSYRF
jgi:long-subunit fatty acid transport protein